jgi:hypothetical protein
MKTSELTGAALDWAVAKCELPDDWSGAEIVLGDATDYSTDWAQGGPIIEREGIWLQPEIGKEGTGNAWYAVSMHDTDSYGPTPLIAAMRCYVASKLGDEVDIPEEIKE